MIRFLVNKMHTVELHYIWAAGLSTDTKPVTGIVTGSRFVEVDTGKYFIFDEKNGSWQESDILPAAGVEF